MVGHVKTLHHHSHQVKPVVSIVSHCLALFLVDRVVDVLSQSICAWIIHHCDTLLNATQLCHVCHHLPCQPIGIVNHHHCSIICSVHIQLCGLLSECQQTACQPHNLQRERWGLLHYGIKSGTIERGMKMGV